MSDRRPIDLESLAALLDGTLTAQERAELLAQIADSPEALELLAEAGAAAAALESEVPAGATGAPTIRPLGAAERRTRRWSPSRLWFPLAAAAVFAAVLVLPRVVRRSGEVPAVILVDAEDLVGGNGAGSVAASLGGGWDNPGWPATRGSAAVHSDRETAFRIGVRTIDLQLSVAGADTPAAIVIGTELAALLSALEGGAALAVRAELVARSASARDGEDLARDVSRFLSESPWFQLGAWAEQARLAVRAGRIEHFAQDGALQGQLRSIASQLEEASGTEGGQVTDALATIRRITADGVTPPELPELRSQLDALVASGGR